MELLLDVVEAGNDAGRSAKQRTRCDPARLVVDRDVRRTSSRWANVMPTSPASRTNVLDGDLGREDRPLS
ncbi:MAG TPA: hypothetical protein VM345_02255 [Acidimicrobiales bacterium]|nr:hypothetical protein [Acidimicrobiales bacterium]